MRPQKTIRWTFSSYRWSDLIDWFLLGWGSGLTTSPVASVFTSAAEFGLLDLNLIFYWIRKFSKLFDGLVNTNFAQS